MPLGGYCEVCARWVWVNGRGECQFGHPASAVHDVQQLKPRSEDDRVSTSLVLATCRSAPELPQPASGVPAVADLSRGGPPLRRPLPAGQETIGRPVVVASLPVDRVDLHLRLVQLARLFVHRSAGAAGAVATREPGLPAPHRAHRRLRRQWLSGPRHRLPAVHVGRIGAARVRRPTPVPSHHVRRSRRREPLPAPPPVLVRSPAPRAPPGTRRRRRDGDPERADPGGRDRRRGRGRSRSPTSAARCGLLCQTAERHPGGAAQRAESGAARPALPQLLPRGRPPHRPRLRRPVPPELRFRPRRAATLARAEASLASIQRAFDSQLAGLLQHQVLDLDSEIALLEKTVQMDNLMSEPAARPDTAPKTGGAR